MGINLKQTGFRHTLNMSHWLVKYFGTVSTRSDQPAGF